MIPGAKLSPIQSVFGHTAGGGTDPDAATAIDAAIKEFLGSTGSREVNGRQLTQGTVATSANGDSFVIRASTQSPGNLVAIALGDPISEELRGARLKAARRRVEIEILNRNEALDAKLVDKNGRPRSLREFAGRPVIVVLIQGAFCKLCMAQLAQLQRQLDPSKVAIVVVTPVDDLKELADVPFDVFADPELNLFKSLRVFRDEPLHGTFVFNSRGEIVVKEIGDEPYTDFAEIKKVLTESRH